MKKRILSMLLVIVMVLSMVPVSALAEGTGTDKVTVTTVNATDGTIVSVYGKLKLKATVTEDLEGQEIRWFSGDSSLATVDGGVVVGKKPAEKVAINVLCSWINFELFAHGYRGYICTWQQVKKALGSQLDEIMQYITNSIIAEREEE